MKIELHITGLEPLVEAINNLRVVPAASVTTNTSAPAESPAPDEEEEAPAPKKKAAKKAPKKKEAAPKKEKPEIKLEELTDLGKKIIASGGPKVLRELLDEVIGAEHKISTCDTDQYPALKEALESKVAELDI